MTHGIPRRIAIIGVAGALAAAGIGIWATGATASSAQPALSARVSATATGRATVSDLSLTKVGLKNARSIAAHSTSTHPSQSNEHFLLGLEGDLARAGGSAPPAAPVTTNVGVTAPGSASASGFPGITGSQQAAVNSASDLEPPDQALCTDGTNVVEAVNNAYAVYSRSGAQVLAPIALSSLFGIPDVSTGNFTSDPRCYYDAATQRWFVVELDIPKYFAAHSHSTSSEELIAVSDSSDPTGSFTTFAIDSTAQSDPGCPCFGDYPMIGADANGFYLTTNDFSIYKPNFDGVQLYAMSKQGLVAAAGGAATPTVVHFSAVASPFPGETVGDTYHLSPALTPADGSYSTAGGGTEYFTMSDAIPTSSNLLAVYALTNTSSLASATPAVALSSSVVTLGQYYQFPSAGIAVPQRPATSSAQTPLLNYIESQTGAAVPGGVIQADFDAAEETTYAHGQLFTELSSASSATAAVGTTTAEWFVLSPSIGSGGVSATLAHEGNLAVTGQSLLYPDLVVNGSGIGDIVFTLTGPSYFPSAAFVSFSGTKTTGQVQVAGAGTGPEDGFTCYDYYVGANYGGCRWGDFSGGVAVGSTVWMATEYVPPASTRDFYTNWGTFVFRAPAG